MRSSSTRSGNAAEICLLTLLYFVTAKLGLLLGIMPGNITAVWIPSGLVLAAVMIRGPRIWPGIFLGAFAGNAPAYLSYESVGSVLRCLAAGTANGIGDTLGAVAAAYLITRTTEGRNPLDRAEDVMRLVVFGAILGSAVSALFGVTALGLAGFVPWPKYVFSLATWATGDAIGVLIITPPLLAWSAGWRGCRFGREELVFALALPMVSLATLWLFPAVPGLVILPMLLWAVFRFDRRVVFLAVFAAAALVVTMTALGNGPFAGGDTPQGLIHLQLFMGLITIPILTLSGALAETGAARKNLVKLNRELEDRVADRALRLEEEFIHRTQAETRAQSSDRLLQLVIDQSQSLTYAKDTDGRFILASQPLAALFGQSSPEKLIGKTSHDFLPQTIADQHRANDLEVMELKTTIQFEETVEAAEGPRTFWSVKYPLLDATGKVYATCGSSVDISLRRRAELEREKLQSGLLELQKMDAVGRLAGGIAHDFNNMLQAILGTTELMLADTAPDDPRTADLNEIKTAAQHSADLTRQLLAFARRQTVNPRVMNINETVAEMLKMLQRMIGEDIELLWNPAADLWPVNIDPSQIDQILANLAVNARDAILGVGRITAKTSNEQVGADPLLFRVDTVPGEYVMLSVSDTGCGMNRETQAHIFEPFFTTKEQGLGTGLGLATVYGIVAQNGGFVDVSSEPGQGTTFRIYLPRHATMPEAKPTGTEDSATPGGTETVLLVEDEPALLRLARRLLEKLGHTVLAAEGPDEALRLAAQHKGEIHLLLTDVVMPGMHGPELARRLLESRPGTKCMFMSGYTADAISDNHDSDEAAHFIQKPFSKAELAAKLREVLTETAEG